MFNPATDLLGYQGEILEDKSIDFDSPIIQGDGTKLWKNKKGQLHRRNGPAVEQFDGTNLYYQNGQLHNDFGPAIIQFDKKEKYFLHGKEYSKEDFLKKGVI
jgi:hypothetical protein